MLGCQFRQSSLKCEQHFVAMQSGINRRVGRVMVSRPDEFKSRRKTI